jgi:hypothetical protein
MKQKNEKKIYGMCHARKLQENKKNKIDTKKQRNPEPLARNSQALLRGEAKISEKRNQQKKS